MSCIDITSDPDPPSDDGRSVWRLMLCQRSDYDVLRVVCGGGPGPIYTFTPETPKQWVNECDLDGFRDWVRIRWGKDDSFVLSERRIDYAAEKRHRDQKELAAEIVAAQRATEPPRAPRGRQLGSGIDTLVNHVRDKLGIRDYEDVWTVIQQGPSDTIKALKNLDPAARQESLRGAYSRGRKPHLTQCAYCKSGLPDWMVKAIETLTRS